MHLSDSYSVLSSAVRIANSGKLSYEARLQAIIELITNSLLIQSATIYLIDEDRRHLTRKISDRIHASASSCCIPFGEGIAGRCAQDKILLTQNALAVHADEWYTDSIHEFTAFPLLDGGRLYGVLTLGTGACGGLCEADLNLLEDLVTVLTGVVNSSAAAQLSDRRTLMMEQFADLVKTLNRSLNPDELVPQLLQVTHRVTDACCTVMRLLPNDDGIPSGIFHKVKFSFRNWVGTFIDIEESCHCKVFSTGQPLLAVDLIADEDIPPSYISVPLLFESRPMGVLTFFGKSHDGNTLCNYNEEERELFFNLATLMANALESGANYRKMVSLTHANQEKVKELLVLYRVGKVMLSTLKLNELISLVLTALTTGPDALFDRAMLFLIDEKNHILKGIFGVSGNDVEEGLLLHDDHQTCAWCLPGGTSEMLGRLTDTEFCTKVRKSQLPLDPLKNVSSQAVLEKRIIHIPDANQELIVDRTMVDIFGSNEFIVAPLIAKDQPIGVLVVDNALNRRNVTDDEIRFLHLFSNQAGTAIENSILYSRLEAANRELSDAQERLIQGERLTAIGEMAASIAHEVKGPLVSIGGFARRLVRKLQPSSDEWRCADTISREVSRLENLLTDILSYSRKATICYTDCSVFDIIEESLTLVSHSFTEHKISVRKHFDNKLTTFLGDSQQLKQVFFNLFMNAQEAMKDGGEIVISVTSARMDTTPAICVRISDSGKGIPPEILPNIFNPFFTTKATGTGLGLPIIHRIIINHQGRIDVANSPEGGASFNIILPLHP